MIMSSFFLLRPGPDPDPPSLAVLEFSADQNDAQVRMMDKRFKDISSQVI